MEYLSKFAEKLTSFWEDSVRKSLHLNDPRTLSFFVLSIVVSILAIFVARRYTKKQQNEKFSSGESTSVKKNVEDDCTHQKADGESDDNDKTAESLNWPSGPDDMMKLPNTCPLSQMYHMSQMSKLTNPDQDEASSDKPEKIDANPETIGDPQEYMSHIQSAVKRSQQRVAVKKLEEEMSETQKDKEKTIQRDQLEAIYKLMEEQKDKFGISDIDEMNNQVKLYM